MTTADTSPANVRRRKRADARRNEQTLLDAAAVVFVRAGSTPPCGTSPLKPASAWAPSIGTSPPGPILS